MTWMICLSNNNSFFNLGFFIRFSNVTNFTRVFLIIFHRYFDEYFASVPHDIYDVSPLILRGYFS